MMMMKMGGVDKVGRRSVRVRAPATTANLGPGFDCLGLALNIWNDVTIQESEIFSFSIKGEGEEDLPRDETNLVVVGVQAAFKAVNKPIPPLKYECVNRIPYARGLGSSSAAIVSGLLSGLLLAGCELPVQPHEALLNLACDLEGHPDNVAPAIYGGMQIGCLKTPTARHPREEAERRVGGAGSEGAVAGGAVAGAGGAVAGAGGAVAGASGAVAGAGGAVAGAGGAVAGAGGAGAGGAVAGGARWCSSRVRLPAGLQCVLFVPDHILETSIARGILPGNVSRCDAIFNASRTALLVNALSNGNMEELQVAMEDRMHQPYRSSQNPHLVPLIEASIAAGAHGACLSGAGPTVLAFTSGLKGDLYSQRRTERVEAAVATAMAQAAAKLGVKGRVLITNPCENGAHLDYADPPFSDDGVVYITNAKGAPV